MTHHRLIILGSGPAGYTAALYAARANLSPLLIMGSQPGGQLMTTTDVDNWPGDVEGLQGPALMERMQAHVRRFGTRCITETALSVDLLNRPFSIQTDAQSHFTCDALIIATGASARYLGLESETRYRGQGVSACATCDGFFYRNKKVAVIGGGNTAVEEALYLSNIAQEVLLVHRRDRLKAEHIMQQKLFQTPRIQVKWNAQLEEVLGDETGVTGIQLRELVSGQSVQFDVEGVFIAIGHQPNTDLFKHTLPLDPAGYILLAHDPHKQTATTIPGVFAAGDVADSVYRQAITSSASGCMAALDAERFLMHHPNTSNT